MTITRSTSLVIRTIPDAVFDYSNLHLNPAVYLVLLVKIVVLETKEEEQIIRTTLNPKPKPP